MWTVSGSCPLTGATGKPRRRSPRWFVCATTLARATLNRASADNCWPDGCSGTHWNYGTAHPVQELRATEISESSVANDTVLRPQVEPGEGKRRLD